ncbi:MAG TPA: dioxygenase [Pseudorhodoplanes sp.]|jgi:catechol 1,2-dioxygenase|nr:dioxygenase [Pseudorhodoplanes sp.]
MIVENEKQLTDAVIAVMRCTPNPRLREIMVALVRHLHDFVREVKLTEDEFREATAILNEIGKLSSDSHNEMVLMAGALGVSSLVCLVNNGGNGQTETSQNLLGPFWRMNSPKLENGASILRSPTEGAPLFIKGHIKDKAGRPVEGARVDVWQASAQGLYENQDPAQADMNLRGQFTTTEKGDFWLRSIRPAGYPIPVDGVVGRLLQAQGRHPFRPAHIHVLAFKPGYKTLISQVYADDDANLETDSQFGVTRALIGRFERHDRPHPDDPAIERPWFSLEYTFVMEPGEATLPRPPIK